MTSDKDRNDRAETAKRHDDSEIIDAMEDAPPHGGVSKHNINQDIATRDDLKQEVGEGSFTRVRDSDKEDANLPRFNQGNSKLNP